MRLANAVHQEHPWVIAQIAPDFRLLDVWRLPACGGAEDFDSLIELVSSIDPTRGSSLPARALFWLRLRLGALLGWDETGRPLAIPGGGETTLAARLPEELRGSVPAGVPRPHVGGISFTPLYRTRQEWAAELSNRTVHGVLQLTWVPEHPGAYRGRMAVYVKTRGLLGSCYMAAIEPFRHAIVYPALMREVERAWKARPAQHHGIDARRQHQAPDRPL